MSEDIIYTLKWKDFTPNVTSRLFDVFRENSFCDVTLVSDDHEPFLAHRYVLISFSPVIENILLNNPHSHPLIYLRGVDHQELDSILQFIYFGKALVDHSNMHRFSKAAKDLQIKKLVENIRMENSSRPKDDCENNEDATYEAIHEDNEYKTESEYAGRSIPDIADEIVNLNSLGSDELENGKQYYKCEECEKSYKYIRGLYSHTCRKHDSMCYFCKYCGFRTTKQSNLKTHQESIHEGVRYSCDQCDYHATQQSHLKTHKQSIHEGVKYSCDQCNYQATRTSHLKDHVKVVHTGVRYCCDVCDYQATQQNHLITHKKSVHDGMKYSCDKCSYRATQQGNLKTHIKSLHDGVTYSCDKCNYEATQQGHLTTHKKSVHEGMKYFCDKCKYQTGRKQNLKEHKGRKHSQLPYS